MLLLNCSDIYVYNKVVNQIPYLVNPNQDIVTDPVIGRLETDIK